MGIATQGFVKSGGVENAKSIFNKISTGDAAGAVNDIAGVVDKLAGNTGVEDVIREFNNPSCSDIVDSPVSTSDS